MVTLSVTLFKLSVMIATFNGCRRSEITVTPANWHTVKASINIPWRINYRFYDPAFKDHPKLKKGKQVKLLGMNHHTTREARQEITRSLIEKEIYDLDKRGYNPITKVFMVNQVAIEFDKQAKDALDITLTTPIITALENSLLFCISEEAINLMRGSGYSFRQLNKKLIIFKEGTIISDLEGNPATAEAAILDFMKEKKIKARMVPETIIECKSVLKFFSQAAALLSMNNMPLQDIKNKEIKAILDNVRNLTTSKTVNKRDEKGRIVYHWDDGKKLPIKVTTISPKVWNDNEFNKYRKVLSILYTELERQEIIENNIQKIPKQNTIIADPDHTKRKVLSLEDRRRIHLALINNFPTFLRWINIFYHGGCRIRELMSVQGKYVDLAGQRFKVLVKKRKVWVWEWKTIKDKALPYWQEAMRNCEGEDYVFSNGLLPGPKPIRVDQIRHRWHRHIQKKLGIAASAYPLKHLHTTEAINELEKLKNQLEFDPIQEAAEHNSHTSKAMVVQIYDIDADKRMHKKIKGLQNTFAG
jgi:integrase